MYDVCIVGAGPAGSTLARLVGRDRRVLLVDRRPLDRLWRTGDPVKPCGGLLAPMAQRELARQGLGVPRHVLGGPQLFGVRVFDFQSGLERIYQRFYVNVDREAFDRWLVLLVPTEVDTAFGWSLEAIEATASEGGAPWRGDGEGTLLRFRTPGGGRASVCCRLVVGADGARSVVRAAVVGRDSAPRRYAAVQALFESDGFEPSYGALFDNRLTDFYGWTIPKGDRTVVGLAAPQGRGARGTFEAFVEQARSRGLLAGEEFDRQAAMLVRPSPSDIHLGVPGVVLVGEAAGLVSPSSGEGIGYALRSAHALADALDARLEGGFAAVFARYRVAALPVVRDVTLRSVKAAALSTPYMRSLLMRSGVSAIRALAPPPLADADGRAAGGTRAGADGGGSPAGVAG